MMIRLQGEKQLNEKHFWLKIQIKFVIFYKFFFHQVVFPLKLHHLQNSDKFALKASVYLYLNNANIYDECFLFTKILFYEIFLVRKNSFKKFLFKISFFNNFIVATLSLSNFVIQHI